MMRGGHFVGFDLDGALIDSKPAVIDCLRHARAYFAGRESDELAEILFPLQLDESRQVLKNEENALWSIFRRSYIPRFDSVLCEFIKSVSRAFDALSYCTKKVCPGNAFLLTNRRLKGVEAILTSMEMRDFFSVVAQAPPNNAPHHKIKALAGLLSQRRSGERGLFVGDHIKEMDVAIANCLQADFVGLNVKEHAADKQAQKEILT